MHEIPRNWQPEEKPGDTQGQLPLSPALPPDLELEPTESDISLQDKVAAEIDNKYQPVYEIFDDETEEMPPSLPIDLVLEKPEASNGQPTPPESTALQHKPEPETKSTDSVESPALAAPAGTPETILDTSTRSEKTDEQELSRPQDHTIQPPQPEQAVLTDKPADSLAKVESPADATLSETVDNPPLQALVADAYQDVLDHNKKNTGPGALFRNTIEALEREEAQTEGEPGKELNDGLEAAKTEADMEGELQQILHQDTLSQVGIEIMPAGGHTNAGKEIDSKELVPTITNTTLFVDYLSQQEPENAQQERNLKVTTDVMNTLHDEIVKRATRSTGDPLEKQLLDDHLEDSLRTFIALDEEYKRLGIDRPESHQRTIAAGRPQYIGEETSRYYAAQQYRENYEELEDYVTYWGRGILPEYIKIGSPEALRQPQTYYLDGMQDRLPQAVENIIELVGPERTTDYGIEAAAAMATGLEKALAELEEPESDWNEADRNLLTENIGRLRQITG